MSKQIKPTEELGMPITTYAQIAPFMFEPEQRRQLVGRTIYLASLVTGKTAKTFSVAGMVTENPPTLEGGYTETTDKNWSFQSAQLEISPDEITTIQLPNGLAEFVMTKLVATSVLRDNEA